MSSGIYQHFRPSEKEFIDRALDWISRVEQKQTFYSSYFLNPRELEILRNLTHRAGLQFYSSPKEAEYQEALLAPDYYQLDQDDFDLTLLETRYSNKFGQITHRQVLGTFLGETGLERRELGDILIAEEKIQVFVSKRLATHFKENIRKIAHFPVDFTEVAVQAMMKVRSTAENQIILVSSLRLDKLIAGGFKISRNLAANMVQSGVVKLNYVECLKGETQLVENDLISIRNYGRIKILQELSLTKKNKHKVEISIISNHKK